MVSRCDAIEIFGKKIEYKISAPLSVCEIRYERGTLVWV
jgi:hypothetical protein